MYILEGVEGGTASFYVSSPLEQREGTTSGIETCNTPHHWLLLRRGIDPPKYWNRLDFLTWKKGLFYIKFKYLPNADIGWHTLKENDFAARSAISWCVWNADNIICQKNCCRCWRYYFIFNEDYHCGVLWIENASETLTDWLRQVFNSPHYPNMLLAAVIYWQTFSLHTQFPTSRPQFVQVKLNLPKTILVLYC